MKPRITLAETELPDGSLLTLQEHDGRRSLLIHGQQICGPATRSSEEEMARLACAPFRPVRQPKLLFVGLGLGHALAETTRELKQKRGAFIVAEPVAEIVEWNRRYQPDSSWLEDTRVSIQDECDARSLARMAGQLHAILLHLDASPMGPRNRPWIEDRQWLAAAHEALQDGGLLTIGGSRPNPTIARLLKRAGFEVADYQVPVSPSAKRTRMMPVWLARKGRYAG